MLHPVVFHLSITMVQLNMWDYLRATTRSSQSQTVDVGLLDVHFLHTPFRIHETHGIIQLGKPSCNTDVFPLETTLRYLLFGRKTVWDRAPHFWADGFLRAHVCARYILEFLAI